MRLALLVSVLSLIFANYAVAHVRSVTPKPDQVVVIHTALGIATMVQTPSPVVPAIPGDQAGFRIEFLDRATIIKPLRSGAKTNLFLITNDQRYNLKLVTGSEEKSDYVVYIKQQQSGSELKWQTLKSVISGSDVTLRLRRIGVSSEGLIVLDGTLWSKNTHLVKPEDFWLLQGKDSKVISGLYLSNVKVDAGKVISIGLAVSKSDLARNQPLTLQIRMIPPLSIPVPGTFLWM